MKNDKIRLLKVMVSPQYREEILHAALENQRAQKQAERLTTRPR